MKHSDIFEKDALVIREARMTNTCSFCPTSLHTTRASYIEHQIRFVKDAKIDHFIQKMIEWYFLQKLIPSLCGEMICIGMFGWGVLVFSEECKTMILPYRQDSLHITYIFDVSLPSSPVEYATMDQFYAKIDRIISSTRNNSTIFWVEDPFLLQLFIISAFL